MLRREGSSPSFPTMKLEVSGICPGGQLYVAETLSGRQYFNKQIHLVDRIYISLPKSWNSIVVRYRKFGTLPFETVIANNGYPPSVTVICIKDGMYDWIIQSEWIGLGIYISTYQEEIMEM